jgi:hypothetical protein
MKEMDLQEIYEDLTPGSQGFVKAVQTWGGIDASNEEIERIASRAKNADEFQDIWENEAWWKDGA